MFEKEIIEYSVFVIYFGAAVLGTLALYTRQVLPVVYIILGAIIGPGGFKLIPELHLVEDLAHIGIIFLLFLLGIDLYPQKLLKIFQSASLITLASSVVFFIVGYVVALVFGFSNIEAVITGIATGFSSTIIGIKLLPTTALHHRHIGELVIGILLLQDLLAILALVVIKELGDSLEFSITSLLPVVTLPVFVGLTFLLEYFVVRRLLHRFEQIREYIFLVTIAWCLGLGQLAGVFGLSPEIGALIAGVALAASPIARFIAERLHAIRDFFMVLFFVAMGAHFDAGAFAAVALPSIVLAGLVLAVKPVTYRYLLTHFDESKKTGWEAGIRLGQLSEFSILIVFLAIASGLIGNLAANFLLVATVLTFAVSSYLIVFQYPTPVAVSDKLRRD